MKLDILYDVHKDLAYKYLKRNVDKDSIDLAIFRSCSDNYTCKKNLYNLFPLIKDSGAILVVCNQYNFSKTLIDAENIGYKTCPMYVNTDLEINYGSFSCGVMPCVYLTKRILHNRGNSAFKCQGWEDLVRLLVSFSSVDDNVLLLGEYACEFIDAFKRQCRNLICFAPNDNNKYRGKGIYIQEVSYEM